MRTVSVIGLGYVGLPLAVAFGEHQKTIGFDVNAKRINQLKKANDVTGEICKSEMMQTDILFTTDPEDLKQADFHIVAVPTPVDENNKPDMTLLKDASATLGSVLKIGDMVVYESTVYPGVTEDICIPILEKESGLISGRDFKVGYSPERVAPSTGKTFRMIEKLIAGQDEVALDIAMGVYKKVMGDLLVPVSSIKVAEASKVLENVQRDVNIALINQVSVLFKKMGIDTHEVLDAAGTKWNFNKFTPGLVGGHCIGVDPYYLIDSGDRLGVELGIIKEARKANEYMIPYIIDQCKNILFSKGKKLKGSTVTVLGLTFKENCPDARNSKAIEIVDALQRRGALVHSYDPVVGVGTEYPLKKSDVVILAVAHDIFKENPNMFSQVLKNDTLFMDVKGVFSEDYFEEDVSYWRM